MDASAAPPDPNATPVTQSPLAGRLHLVGVSTMYRRAVFDDDEAARVVARAHGARWLWRDSQVLAWVLLPAQWQALLKLGDRERLPALMGRFKGSTSRGVEARHRVNGWLWARGFSDRALADGDDPLAVARRLVAAPVQAGLVARVGDHAYWDSTWLR